jgi:hypothetical protein
MENTQEIFVFLPDEAVNVWRPVQAIQIGNDLYQIPKTTIVPEDEIWQFLPGDIVRCRDQLSEDGKKILVAFKKVE